MKERPILFSTDGVKAILDGKKTMTRRVIKPQPETVDFIGYHLLWKGKRFINASGMTVDCPYGQVGSRLWVRETHTWVTLAEKDPWKDRAIADGSFRRDYNGEPVTMIYKADGYEIGARWRPSIHMPRWASRINLEITEVRAERLQEITEADAIDEGAIVKHSEDTDESGYSFRLGFIDLWDSLNAKRGYGWEENNWVWVISFNKEVL